MRNYVLCFGQKESVKGSRRIAFEESLAKVKLSALTPSRVERFKEDLRDAGVSIPLTRAILRNLSSMLAFARRRDYVHVNAASDIKVIGNRNEGSEKVVPPSPVLMKAMIAAASPEFQTMLKFLSLSGARISEALALRWRHLDLEENEVHIRTSVDEKTLQEDGYGAKTNAGNRRIPIALIMMKELAEWRERSRYQGEDDLIFPNSHGRYRSQGNDRKRKLIPLYHKVVGTVPKKARLAEELGFHALRHYAISAWIAQGLPLKAISTFAGHSSVKITMDRYGHLFPSEDHAAAMERVALGLV